MPLSKLTSVKTKGLERSTGRRCGSGGRPLFRFWTKKTFFKHFQGGTAKPSALLLPGSCSGRVLQALAVGLFVVAVEKPSLPAQMAHARDCRGTGETWALPLRQEGSAACVRSGGGAGTAMPGQRGSPSGPSRPWSWPAAWSLSSSKGAECQASTWTSNASAHVVQRRETGCQGQSWAMAVRCPAACSDLRYVLLLWTGAGYAFFSCACRVPGLFWGLSAGMVLLAALGQYPCGASREGHEKGQMQVSRRSLPRYHAHTARPGSPHRLLL